MFPGGVPDGGGGNTSQPCVVTEGNDILIGKEIHNYERKHFTQGLCRRVWAVARRNG